MFAKTISPPYYAVIFTYVKTDIGSPAYRQMSEKLNALVHQQPGFLGVEDAYETIGISVSYWKDLHSIQQWKQQADHRLARQKGKSTWYQAYKVRIAKVERDYGFNRL